MMLVVALVVTLSGCANSMVLGTVYDGFGSKTAKRFKSYASFSESQKAQIDSLAASYHSWHRTTQLDRYAAFLRSVVAEAGSDGELSLETAGRWWQSARGFSDDLRACNPLNVAAGLLASLSDKQVGQMAANMRQELNEREDEYKAESPEERREERVKSMTKWGRRAGVSFNDAQARLLRETLQQQISLGAQWYELRRLWMEEFILLINQRDQANFQSSVTRHIDSGWRLTESRFPEQWKFNEDLWTGYIQAYINLQTDEQRQIFTNRFTATARTLEKLADKQINNSPVCHQQQ